MSTNFIPSRIRRCGILDDASTALNNVVPDVFQNLFYEIEWEGFPTEESSWQPHWYIASAWPRTLAAFLMISAMPCDDDVARVLSDPQGQEKRSRVEGVGQGCTQEGLKTNGRRHGGMDALIQTASVLRSCGGVAHKVEPDSSPRDEISSLLAAPRLSLPAPARLAVRDGPYGPTLVAVA
eukprot:TRINITY_DN32941_c0_g1_i1.p1 TRINITY_DN32941_c0_g1~~TRINITY_DN32941_c0_g1_i1.p1  ORF type:complete len:180 (-),score=5.23 TRINITY_DN32941_c0_g1_i1:42-581(-)